MEFMKNGCEINYYIGLTIHIISLIMDFISIRVDINILQYTFNEKITLIHMNSTFRDSTHVLLLKWYVIILRGLQGMQLWWLEFFSFEKFLIPQLDVGHNAFIGEICTTKLHSSLDILVDEINNMKLPKKSMVGPHLPSTNEHKNS